MDNDHRWMIPTTDDIFRVAANVIRKYYNRHGVYTFTTTKVMQRREPLVKSIALKGKFTPELDLILYTDMPVELTSEFQTMTMFTRNHFGAMITKIDQTKAKNALVGEIELVAERANPLTIVLKARKIGNKISARTVSIGPTNGGDVVS